MSTSLHQVKQLYLYSTMTVSAMSFQTVHLCDDDIYACTLVHTHTNTNAHGCKCAHTHTHAVAEIHFERAHYNTSEGNGFVLVCVVLETLSEIPLQVQIFTLGNTCSKISDFDF